MAYLTHLRLKEVLSYNPNTGVFTWNDIPSPRTPADKFRNTRFAGKAAGTPMKGYIRIWIDGTAYLAHRLAWLYANGAWPDGEIDHINRDRRDNRINNLRAVSRDDNMHNKSMYKSNSSGVTGVSLNKKSRTWVAYIQLNGTRKWLGHFASRDEAASARNSALSSSRYTYNHGE